MKGCAWTLALCAAFIWMNASAQTVSTIISSGDPANRVDIVIVGDGYTSAQQAQFDTDARASLSAFLNFGFFADYSSYFNVRTLFVASVESGASHLELTPPTVKNTAFSAFYGCAGVDRLICVDNAKVATAVNAVLPAIQRDYVFVLVNDTTYGGSGGSLLVSSTHALAPQIVLHEFGHTHGLLVDEYTSNPPPCSLAEPAGVNATLQTARNLIKWNYWIDAATIVPTTGNTTPGIPGLYEGADYCATGMYRPTYNSMMRSLGAPYDQINEEQMVRRLYNFVSPVDSFSPTATSFSVPTGSQPKFAVSPLVPLQHALQTSWAVDSVAAGTGSSFDLDTRTLTVGSHTVVATVRDTTTRVRSDPTNLLTDTQSWILTVTATSALAATATLQAAPSQPTPGQNVALTATVTGPSGAAAPTGTVAFRDGTIVIGTGTLNGSGQATFATAALAPGTHSITAAYSGDSVYQVATSSAVPVMVLAQSTTTLTATPSQINVGQSVALAAAVTSSFGSQPPAGTVTFLDGTTQIGSATLDASGHATLATSSLVAGTRSITAQYTGGATFQASVSAATVVTVTVPPDFTLSAAPLTLDVQAGRAGQVVLTATPNGSAAQTLSVSCSGLPSQAICNFTPSSVVLNGTAATTTLTVSTVAAVASLLPTQGGEGRGPTLAFMFLFPLLGLGRKQSKRGGRLALLMMVALFGLASCGGGGDSSSAPGNPGTPTGTSVIVVTAFTSGTAAVSHTISVTMNVTK